MAIETQIGDRETGEEYLIVAICQDRLWKIMRSPCC